MIRLGLCCLFSETPIKFRTVTAKSLSAEEISMNVHSRLKRVSELIIHNVAALKQSIVFCAQNDIGCFRISSQLFPCYTHPSVGYRLEQLPDEELIVAALGECRRLSEKYDIRLSMHPDQFVVLNSPSESVVNNSICELEYHAVIAQLVGVDVINIHVGGVYGDKKTAMENFVRNFPRLSQEVKTRLTLENDDKSYGPKEVLQLCECLHIPFVYDVHHHRCTDGRLANQTIQEISIKAAATWKGRQPLFHISSPLGGWNSANPRTHDRMIVYSDFPSFWKHWKTKFTLEVEAKSKELAVAKLHADLLQHAVPLWECVRKPKANWQPVMAAKAVKRERSKRSRSSLKKSAPDASSKRRHSHKEENRREKSASKNLKRTLPKFVENHDEELKEVNKEPLLTPVPSMQICSHVRLGMLLRSHKLR